MRHVWTQQQCNPSYIPGTWNAIILPRRSVLSVSTGLVVARSSALYYGKIACLRLNKRVTPPTPGILYMTQSNCSVRCFQRPSGSLFRYIRVTGKSLAPPPHAHALQFFSRDLCVRTMKVKRQLRLKSGNDRNILMHAARGGDQMGVTAVVNACREHFCPAKVCDFVILFYFLFCCEFDPKKKARMARHDLWKDNRFVLRNNIYLYALYARVQNKNDR